MRTLLIRGLLCGVVAALFAFVFAHQFGEPQIDQAIAFEDHLHAVAGQPREPELFSRSIQSGWGLFTAVVVIGTTLGGIFSTACALAYGRLGQVGMRTISALFAGLAYIAIVIVPSIKYPPNPPAIGLASTIGFRTELYFSMIALSICLLSASGILAWKLQHKYGTWNGFTIATLAYIVSIALIQALLPPISEAPREFPAELLWSFRLASLGTQAIMWGTLGLLFGFVCEREPQSASRRLDHKIGQL